MGTRMKTWLVLLTIAATVSCTEDYLKKTVIPAGTGEKQVRLTCWEESENLYSVLGFFVDSTHNLFFQEEGTGKIKVFNDRGTYLRTLKDYGCQYLFLYGNEFIGQQLNEEKEDELIFFSKEDGSITYRVPITLEPKRWAARGIKNGMLLFSRDGVGDRTQKAFDIENKQFLVQDLKEWDSTAAQQACSTYVEYGAEEIGVINDYYLFWFPPPPKDTTYEYSLRTVGLKTGKITPFQVIFRWQDVGLGMPGLTGAFIDNRYIYTIGHPRIKKGSPPEIWVTRIDVKALMPDI